MNDREWVLIWEDKFGNRTVGNHFHTTMHNVERSVEMVREQNPGHTIYVAELVKMYPPKA